jgi:tetratricopeptide (TPR) repeat protein
MQTELDRAEADLTTACDEARARVAADPANEEAAEELFQAVSSAAGSRGARKPQAARDVSPEIAQAARLLDRNQDEEAELLLRRYLSRVRNDPAAMLLMANIAAKSGFPENARKILQRSVEVDPGRTENWLALAQVLHAEARDQDKVELLADVFDALDAGLKSEPEHEEALAFKASVLAQIRRVDDSLAVFAKLLRAYPENAPAWINYAHSLKTLGRFGEAVAAYRTAIALNPAEGATWWLLADMKLARFFQADIDRMEGILKTGLPELISVNLHFALASAYDQAGDYSKAAEHLRIGNALRLKLRPHNMDAMRQSIDAAIRTYAPSFFASVAGAGAPDDAPIFVVGMPRSGSTLVEQILASHSAVEGTAELFAIQQMEHELLQDHPGASVEEVVAGLDRSEFKRLGGRYLDLTRFQRRTDRPRFVDKNPGNWRQTGLIHAILPNARIIDIRRNPLDCCFANYKQHFMLGVNYSYGLKEVATYYQDYVRLMRHLDEVIPGAVHRVIYEDLVENTEIEVHRLFEFLGLPFEEGCLRFFETERAVHTPSAQQVRQPMNTSGIGKWAPYEPWIRELRDALGETLEDWRR